MPRVDTKQPRAHTSLEGGLGNNPVWECGSGSFRGAGSLLHGSCSWKVSLPAALPLLSGSERPWASKVTTGLSGWQSVTSHLAFQYLKLGLVPRITELPGAEPHSSSCLSSCLLHLTPRPRPLPATHTHRSEQMPVKTKTKTSSSSLRPGLSDLLSWGQESMGHCGAQIT